MDQTDVVEGLDKGQDCGLRNRECLIQPGHSYYRPKTGLSTSLVLLQQSGSYTLGSASMYSRGAQRTWDELRDILIELNRLIPSKARLRW